MTKQICPNCNQEFDPADRAGPTTQEASEVQIVYCSTACKRQAGNKRYYQRHRDEVLRRNLQAQGYEEAAQKLAEKLKQQRS